MRTHGWLKCGSSSSALQTSNHLHFHGPIVSLTVVRQISFHTSVNMVAERRLARRIADVLVPLIMEEIVETVKVVLQERISERIREHIVDVHVPRVVEQVTEVPKTSSRDRTLQCTAEQSLDVLVPEMVKQLVEVPETVSQDRIQAADCGADR